MGLKGCGVMQGLIWGGMSTGKTVFERPLPFNLCSRLSSLIAHFLLDMNQGRLLFVYFTHNIAAGAHDMALC
jgi:hypothetical protein